MTRRALVALATLLVCFVANSAQVMLEFDSVEQQKRYRALIDELRCMVCQNQNVADSNAELAKDLRERTYSMIKGGATDDQILEFMTDRYGDFVLYRPPFNLSTALLWLAPALFLILAFAAYWSYSRRRRESAGALSREQRMEVRRLLDE